MSMAGREQQGWTPEREQRLRDLAAQNYSAEMIYEALGATSRNAVVGKAHRMGVHLTGNHHSGIKRTKRPPQPKSDGRLYSSTVQKIARKVKERAAAATAPALPATEAVDLPPEIIPADQRKTLYELTENTCRWPVGHPTDADFHFCGGSAPGERPYCAGHSRIAYETPAQRVVRLAAWRAANASKVRAA